MAIEFKRVDRTVVQSKSGLYLTAGSQVVHLSTADNEKLTIKKGELKSMDVPADGTTTRIDIIYGVYRLVSGFYLAAVTQSRVRAKAPRGQDLSVIEKLELFPVSGKDQAMNLSTKALKEERTFLEFIVETVASHNLYYSETYDLTHTLQRQSAMAAESKDAKDAAAEPLWKRADARFFWNRALLNDFVNAELHDWIVPVSSMFIESRQANFGDVSARLLFISRRGHLRQGTRLWVRGIDETGNVANYVETEQIAIKEDGSVFSFVEIRGSVPVFWTQIPSLKYTAKIEFSAGADANAEAAYRHFNQQTALYGEVICVNLINKHGSELKLGTAFEETVAKVSPRLNNRVKYVWFDFHHECGSTKWANLSKLVNEVSTDFDRFGFYSADANGKVITRQTGVMRTNCVDNLDRTNVVQSLFGRRSLLQQFDKTSDSVLTSPFDDFEKMFKNLWADNADAVSVLYSGTGALKTDFTRTGKRTNAGKLQDGWNSGMRYYLNNFCDGRRQDALDVFLGKYAPEAAIGGSKSGSYYQSDGAAIGPHAKNPIVRMICIVLLIICMLVTAFQCPSKKLTNRPKLRPSEYIKPSVELTSVLSNEGLATVNKPRSKH